MLAALWHTIRRYSFLIAFVVVVGASAAYGALHQAAVDHARFDPPPAATPTGAPAATRPTDKPPRESARDLFVHACGTCHTLRDAGAGAGVGPNLDKVRPRLRARRVREQIRTGTLDSAMPANLLVGRDAERVARYVARVAGRRR